MVYHGQPRILTEIASANLADPFVNPAGADRPLGPQEARWNFPLPYRRGDWRLRQIVDYGITAVFAGLSHVAKYRTNWLENFYRIHADWANRKEAPYAFVIPASQRDPFEARELLDILRTGAGRGPEGGRRVHGGRQAVRRRLSRRQGCAALRRVRKDDAREAGLPGPAALSRRSAEAALRRHRSFARDADGRRRRSDRYAVRGDSGRRQ